MRFSPRFKRIFSLLTISFLLAICIQAGLSSAQQGGGIGVDNDGPSFMDISISETDLVTFVNVEIRDLNGWTDIFSINVTILDNQENAISQVSYMQYPNLQSTTVMIIDWNETVGTYLLGPPDSTWLNIPVAPWNPNNADMEIGLRVSFALQKFSGQSISIRAMDRGQLTCEYRGPFSAEYTPAPAWENVAVPISLSTIIAVCAGGFMAYRRFKNNKLARAVEASHTVSGED
jgi:hypothetical protein